MELVSDSPVTTLNAPKDICNSDSAEVYSASQWRVKDSARRSPTPACMTGKGCAGSSRAVSRRLRLDTTSMIRRIARLMLVRMMSCVRLRRNDASTGA